MNKNKAALLANIKFSKPYITQLSLYSTLFFAIAFVFGWIISFSFFGRGMLALVVQVLFLPVIAILTILGYAILINLAVGLFGAAMDSGDVPSFNVEPAASLIKSFVKNYYQFLLKHSSPPFWGALLGMFFAGVFMLTLHSMLIRKERALLMELHDIIRQ